jgi:cell division protein FtsL
MAVAAPAKRRSTRTRAKTANGRGAAAPTTRAARNARALENARAAHAAAVPATRPARRKSGPSAPRTQPGTVRAGRVAQARGAQVLDGLLRGRSWVALVGVLLAGIVFLNVSVLQLNRGIASTDAQSAALEQTNSGLRAQVAKLDSAERIQRLAAARGFVLPQPGQLAYIKPGRSDARLAAQRIAPPITTQQTTTPAPPTPAPTPQYPNTPTAQNAPPILAQHP